MAVWLEKSSMGDLSNAMFEKKPEGNYGFHKFMLSIHVFFIFSLCSLFVDQLNDQTT